ncbi:hypothetical protein [Streptomyces sp. NBC_00069]|uniref:hypothetical protein n=1 Tax=Streptomyces sp. NBC_00069 TaxID=2975639 RepID=UPI00324E611A
MSPVPNRTNSPPRRRPPARTPTSSTRQSPPRGRDSRFWVRFRILTPRELADELRRQVIEDTLRAGSDARLEWPRHGMVQDVSAGVGDIDVLVLVLTGSHDKIDPPAC